MAPTGLVESFVAAIQASLSVLLVIFYGGVAARLGLLNNASTKAISKVCVRLFLPALLFTKIGAELHAGSAHRYVVVLVWALVCHVVSFVLGIAGHLLLGMPDWTTVAVMFNNTTSYPLLLISALDQTGILQSLVGADETTRAAIDRAKSYFLVFSTVSSCLTFAVGPRLIDSEHAPEPDAEDSDLEEEGKNSDAGDEDVEDDADNDADADADDEGGIFDDAEYNPPADGPSDGYGDESGADLSRPISRSSGYDPLSDAPPISAYGTPANETTGLLSPYGSSNPKPSSFRASIVQFVDPFASAASSNAFFPSLRHKSKAKQPSAPAAAAQGAIGASAKVLLTHLNRRVSVVPKTAWRRLSPRVRWWLLFVADFFNAPLLGALAGAVVGLTPALHRAFFSDAPDGGIFTAWLTASLDDIGGLFVPLPVVVAGVSLYTAMQTTKSDANGTEKPLPRATVVFILFIRFVLWPLASVGTIYVLASRTELVGDDPMLWFALMLMPTGPPAMKLITLVQVSDAEDGDETSIAKLLTISYLISPLLSFTVVGSLRASLAGIHT